VTSILVICTGNAARSVMAGAALTHREPSLSITTAGTFSVDGQPISWRTRDALRHVGLEAKNHRSKQIVSEHIESADLILAMAPEHVNWVRREFPAARARTVTLKRLARDLAPDGPLAHRLAALELGSVEIEPWEEIIDPGGGEVEDFISCAVEVVELIDQVIDRLRPVTPR
jgi:protein-tyrosine-phosphatase